MNPTCTLPGCGQPSNMRVCDDCLKKFAVALAEVIGEDRKPGLYAALCAAYTKTGSGSTGTRRSAESALPYDTRAGEALRQLRAELVSAVRMLWEARNGPWPADHEPAMAHWLLQRMDGIRRYPEPRDLIEPLHSAIDRGWEAADRPDETFAGRCDPCEMALYAPQEDTRVTCWRCNAEYLVVDGLKRLLDRCQYLRVSREHIPVVLVVFRCPVPDGTVRSWFSRGQLLRDEAGQVRVRDLLTLARREEKTGAVA